MESAYQDPVEELILDDEEEKAWQREMADAKRLQQSLMLSKLCLLFAPGIGHAVMCVYLLRWIFPRIGYSESLRRRARWVLGFNLTFVGLALAVIAVLKLRGS